MLKYSLSLLIWFVCLTTQASTQPVSAWHFSHDITSSDRKALKNWLTEIQLGLNRLFGPSPDRYEIHIKRKASKNSPVPWAHTSKGATRKVHLYIDTAHSWDEFRADWTASHELSHMLFPYVGADRWFSEGLASYLQYQVMYASEHIDWSSAVRKIEERFQRVNNSRVPSSWSVLKHNKDLAQHRDYPRLYWGGAAYFALVDRRLQQEQGTRLHQVIRQYALCCYSPKPSTALKMLELFDTISNSNLFMQTYHQQMQSDGTPNTNALGLWLLENPPKFGNDS